jgi:hypothetical protein
VHGCCTSDGHENHEIFDRALVRADHRGRRTDSAGRWRTRRAHVAGHDADVADAIAIAVANARSVADGPVDAVADAEPAAGLAFDAINAELTERAVDAELAIAG